MNSVTLAFLRRDFTVWASYRLSVLSQLGSVFLMIGVVYFLGRMVNSNVDFQRYGGDYVSFLLSGVAFTELFGRGLGFLPYAIRENQQNGTLEPMLATPLRLSELVISSALFNFLLSVGRAVIMLLFGVLALDLWHNANIFALFVVLVPGVLVFFGVSMLITAFVILFKQADPIIAAYGAATVIFGGLLFPVEALPDWLRPLSLIVPLSHALSGVRLALMGEPISTVAFQAFALLLLAIVIIPAAVLSLKWSMNRARRNGSLAQY